MDVLRKRQYKQYSKLSKYQLFPIFYHTLDEKYVQGIPANLFDDTAFVWHVVKEGDTYDKLAVYYYNNPVYYWIICDYNRVQNPFDVPKVGTKIKIPTFSDIQFDTL